MRYDAPSLATGFTAPRGITEALVSVIYSADAWSAFLDREYLRDQLGSIAPPDWNRTALLWITAHDQGGTDVRPVVASVTRDERALSVTVTLAPIPGAQALDVDQRPWVLTALDRGALAGDPELRFTIDGQRAVRVEHLGRAAAP